MYEQRNSSVTTSMWAILAHVGWPLYPLADEQSKIFCVAHYDCKELWFVDMYERELCGQPLSFDLH